MAAPKQYHSCLIFKIGATKFIIWHIFLRFHFDQYADVLYSEECEPIKILENFSHACLFKATYSYLYKKELVHANDIERADVYIEGKGAKRETWRRLPLFRV